MSPDKTEKTTNVLVAGVGGQGIVLASELLALAAMADGLEAKQSEVHGVAQRGGSVNSHVRWGEKLYSPLIARGEVVLEDGVVTGQKGRAKLVRRGPTFMREQMQRFDPNYRRTLEARATKDAESDTPPRNKLN